jgi:NADH-quinone oxidoreductase subunit M
MIALWIVLLPIAGALACLAAGRTTPVAARGIAVAVLAIDTGLLVSLWAGSNEAGLLASWSAEWIPALGIRFAVGIDGLSLVLSIMASAAATAALIAAPAVRPDEGSYSALLLLTVAGVLGVFAATDLMLFFVFYEIMLLPAAALILRWGSGDRMRAAIRFFVFTQAGGLLMLIAIVGLHALHFDATGVRTFDITALQDTALSDTVALLFLVAFTLAFAVKLPVVPFHTWQPEAYTSASSETAILLSALMAKTAGYGLLRFAVPMSPGAIDQVAPWAIGFGLLTILYASWLAYGQRDLKRLIAYSSAAHLGYVVLGAFAGNDLAFNGAVIQLFCHGFSVTGLFLIADHIERHTGTRDIDRIGGVWHSAPRLGSLGLVLILATLGLPGLGNFIGEFLVLVGLYKSFPAAAAVGAAGAVLSAAYSLRLMQRVFFGPRVEGVHVPELPLRAVAMCAALVAVLIWAGLNPAGLIEVLYGAPVVFDLGTAP